jgi:type III pantothenate kinase
MILTLDVGNSQIHGGLFDAADQLKLQFRKTSSAGLTSDELGLFLRSILRENNLDPKAVKHIALCSVVPDIVHSLRNACKKYFDIQPFILQAGVRTGLRIRYRNPEQMGSDRIATAIAGLHLFPGRNLIIADYGTATTFCAVTAEKEHLGGMILPGLRLSMEALESKTAKLPAVEIVEPEEIVGRSTVENIQSGLYFGNLHILRGVTEQIKREYFSGADSMLLGTGGFSRLFEKSGVFDALVPELALIGLHRALKMNL